MMLHDEKKKSVTMPPNVLELCFSSTKSIIIPVPASQFFWGQNAVSWEKLSLLSSNLKCWTASKRPWELGRMIDELKEVQPSILVSDVTDLIE